MSTLFRPPCLLAFAGAQPPVVRAHEIRMNLIWDGVRKSVDVCIKIADALGVPGWRQVKHLRKKIKKLAQTISRISASKSPKKADALQSAYRDLLERTTLLLTRAKTLLNTAKSGTEKGPGAKTEV